MRVQVLVAAMNQTDHKLLEKMNIQTDAIVGNQCEVNSVETFDYKGHKVTYLSFAERGVGLNRNNTLIRATEDICLFADDDMIYVDGYENIILDSFKKQPDADALVFNITTIGGNAQQRRINKKSVRVRLYNSMNYGAVRIAVKRTSLMKKRICFSQFFGGGSIYSSGEDSLLVRDMLRYGLRIYTVPINIATVDQSTSTWFTGYHEKFFYDKGALMKSMFPRLYWLMTDVYFPIKYRKIAHKPMSYIRKLMRRGSRCYVELIKY